MEASISRVSSSLTGGIPEEKNATLSSYMPFLMEVDGAGTAGRASVSTSPPPSQRWVHAPVPARSMAACCRSTTGRVAALRRDIQSWKCSM